MKRRNFVATGILAGATGLMDKNSTTKKAAEIAMWQASKHATLLFDGKDLSAWLARKGGEAKWKIQGGYMEVAPGTGDIHTKEVFGDCHLHVEF